MPNIISFPITRQKKSPDNQLLFHEQYFSFKIVVIVFTLLMARLLSGWREPISNSLQRNVAITTGTGRERGVGYEGLEPVCGQM